jgi:hypothetical protein
MGTYVSHSFSYINFISVSTILYYHLCTNIMSHWAETLESQEHEIAPGRFYSNATYHDLRLSYFEQVIKNAILVRTRHRCERIKDDGKRRWCVIFITARTQLTLASCVTRPIHIVVIQKDGACLITHCTIKDQKYLEYTPKLGGKRQK